MLHETYMRAIETTILVSFHVFGSTIFADIFTRWHYVISCCLTLKSVSGSILTLVKTSEMCQFGGSNKESDTYFLLCQSSHSSVQPNRFDTVTPLNMWTNSIAYAFMWTGKSANCKRVQTHPNHRDHSAAFMWNDELFCTRFTSISHFSAFRFNAWSH